MTAVRVHVAGLKELDAKLGSLGPRLGPATLSLAMQRAAEPTVALARSLAPYDETREKGRHLRDAITASPKLSRRQRVFVAPGAAHVFVGPSTKAPHGHLIEFGHRIVAGRRKTRRVPGRRRAVVVSDTRRQVGFAPPRPFLRPAWEATRTEVLRRFATDVWNVAVAVARGARSATESGSLDRRAASSLEDA